jgi:hypothetical protein
MNKKMPITIVRQLCLGGLIKEFGEIRWIGLFGVRNGKRAAKPYERRQRDGAKQCREVKRPGHNRPSRLVKGQPMRR